MGKSVLTCTLWSRGIELGALRLGGKQHLNQLNHLTGTHDDIPSVCNIAPNTL